MLPGDRLDVIDPPLAAIRALLNLVLHYRGIRKDPPDPAFEQLTGVEVASAPPNTRADALLGSALELARRWATEAAIAEAFLHSIERYQGAAQESDGKWALRHARGAREHAALLAEWMPLASDGLAALVAALASDGRDLGGTALTLQAMAAQVTTTGLTTEQEQLLRNALVDDGLRAEILAEAAAVDSAAFTETDLAQLLADGIPSNAATASVLDGTAMALATIVATLEADPAVLDLDPYADAGGPYAGAENAALALDGSASTAAPGRALVSWEWDIDGDGAFDDASGVAPSVLVEAGPRLIGVRVTDDLGAADLAYAVVVVAETNLPPVAAAVSPLETDLLVRLGETVPFEVSAGDPDGDPVSVEWWLDGIQLGSGPLFSYAPVAGSEIGIHILQARVSDGQPLGGLATDPQLWQDVSGLVPGALYTVRGDYRSFSPIHGNPAKPDAFAVFADDQLVLALPRPVADNVDTSWAPFAATFAAPGETVRILFEAERDGDDSSFDVDNLSLTGEPAAAGSEGMPLTLAVPFADAGVEDTHQALVDWGDGSPSGAGGITFGGGSGEVSAMHTYAENGGYTGEVCLEDDDGGTACASFNATVANAAPLVAAGPDVAAGPGLALAATTFADPGVLDTHSATVDWGDGGGPEPASVDAAGGAGGVSGSHLYASDGAFTVEICVTDDDGGTGCDTFAAAVAAVNQPPTATAQPDQSGVEGAAFVHALAFEDPNPSDTHTATVDWGDGGAPEPLAHLNDGGARGFGVASHIYRDDGDFLVRFALCDPLPTCDQATALASIANLPPELGPPLGSAIGPLEIEIAAAFTDPGELDTHSAEHEWGDGQSGPALITQASGGGMLEARHVYAVAGAYQLRVCVTDDDGSADCEELEALVEGTVGDPEEPVAPAIPSLGAIGLALLGVLLGLAGLSTLSGRR